MSYFQKKISHAQRFIVMFVGVFLLLSMQSCTKYASTGENLYKQSRNGPVLDVPPPLTRDNISNFYVLPNPSNQAG